MSKSPHIPRHFDGPPEQKTVLDPKTKLLVSTVRDAVLALLEKKDSVTVKGYRKAIDWNHPRGDLGKRKSIKVPFSNEKNLTERTRVKNTIHRVLDAVGINKKNTDKRLRTAVEKLGKQYAAMSPERFAHRLLILDGKKVSKVERDAGYLLGNMKLFMGFGKNALRQTLDMLFSDGNFVGLHKSASLFAMKQIIEKAKEMKRHLPGGGESYKQFKEILYRVADSF